VREGEQDPLEYLRITIARSINLKNGLVDHDGDSASGVGEFKLIAYATGRHETHPAHDTPWR
jgi:hypothetical protein